MIVQRKLALICYLFAVAVVASICSPTNLSPFKIIANTNLFIYIVFIISGCIGMLSLLLWPVKSKLLTIPFALSQAAITTFGLLVLTN